MVKYKNAKSYNRYSQKKSRGMGYYNKSVYSNRSSGCVTKNGKTIYNPKAYAATGAPLYSSRTGKKIKNVKRYLSAVYKNSIDRAARSAIKRNPKAKAYSYVLTLKTGKKYVGYTTNPTKRLNAHCSNKGAQVTRELKPVSVKITPHGSIKAAKIAETNTYYFQKSIFGYNNVRGAGNTSRFSIT